MAKKHVYKVGDKVKRVDGVEGVVISLDGGVVFPMLVLFHTDIGDAYVETYQEDGGFLAGDSQSDLDLAIPQTKKLKRKKLKRKKVVKWISYDPETGYSSLAYDSKAESQETFYEDELPRLITRKVRF